MDQIARCELLLKWVDMEITFSWNPAVVHQLLCVQEQSFPLASVFYRMGFKLDNLIKF